MGPYSHVGSAEVILREGSVVAHVGRKRWFVLSHSPGGVGNSLYHHLDLSIRTAYDICVSVTRAPCALLFGGRSWPRQSDSLRSDERACPPDCGMVSYRIRSDASTEGREEEGGIGLIR